MGGELGAGSAGAPRIKKRPLALSSSPGWGGSKPTLWAPRSWVGEPGAWLLSKSPSSSLPWASGALAAPTAIWFHQQRSPYSLPQLTVLPPSPCSLRPLPQGDGGTSAMGHVASFPFVSASSRAQALRKRACAYFCLRCGCCVCKHTCACLCEHAHGPCPARVLAVGVHGCAGSCRPMQGRVWGWHGVSAHICTQARA